jgi:hypothetical protein
VPRDRKSIHILNRRTLPTIDSGCAAVALPGPGAPTYNNTASEDCLFLNVWTKPQVGERKKAVLVWIFGGGFSVGDTADPLYNGAKLAQNQDVVVVVNTVDLFLHTTHHANAMSVDELPNQHFWLPR